MNSCILLVKVLQNPELRYTQDSQTPVAELAVEFEGDREGDAPSSLKVVGWGNLATEIQQTYHEGDRLVVEGRLSIRTIDRPDGIKEKKAELVASRIYALGDAGIISASPQPTERNSEPSAERASARSTASSAPSAATVSKPAAAPAPLAGGNEINYDDIPF
jgi:single-stranded DNA-binding protein